MQPISFVFFSLRRHKNPVLHASNYRKMKNEKEKCKGNTHLLSLKTIFVCEKLNQIPVYQIGGD